MNRLALLLFLGMGSVAFALAQSDEAAAEAVARGALEAISERDSTAFMNS